MKIVIDISPLSGGHKLRGVGMYTRNLVAALRQVDTENEYVLTSKPERVTADLIHYPYYDFFFQTLPFRKIKPTVVTIHDTIPLIYPKYYPPGLRGKIRSWLQQNSLKSVTAIITDSNRSKKDIERYLKQPTEKIHRVYLAVNKPDETLTGKEVGEILSKYQIKTPYYLYVGDINYNKNIPGLIKAWAAVDLPAQLVIVSRAMAAEIPEAREIRRLITKLGMESKCTVLTNVPLDPKKELEAIYQGAAWYIQPSFYEGFGLPVLEALSLGTPVMVSTGGSLPEITPPGAITFEPELNESLIQAFKKANKWTVEEKTRFMVEAKKWLTNFTWEKTARETIKVYEQVIR
jgi:glycosyltransferase involved in cell wall biosynthesis